MLPKLSRWCRINRLVSERVAGVALRKARKLRDEVYNNETYMPTNEIAIPIILCIVTICMYLAGGAFIFHHCTLEKYFGD